MAALAHMVVFPGFLFLSIFGMYCSFLERKLYARLQSRVGPPWFQPYADFVKLVAKENIMPEDANPMMFSLMPVFALTAVTTAILYIPIWGTQALFSFTGDIIVVLYLLTLPTLAFFIGGWYSTSLYARIGAVRTLGQLFAYEVPLFMSILAPAILAESWSLSGISQYYSQHPWYCLFNIIGFVVSLVAMLAKLEKAPFDIPEAETEIGGGCFTEYSGKLLAFFKLTLMIEMVVGGALLSSVFLPFGLTSGPVIGFIIFLVKSVVVVALFAAAHALLARLRIDQILDFCWKLMIPAALVQVVINLVIKMVVR
jgi:NADH-quinone oxidoreductase subunit H